MGNLLKPYAALLCAALLTTTLTATEAHAADPAPTNVQISWKDDTRKLVHVSWSEEGEQPDRVSVRYQTGKVLKTMYVAAGAPNELDIPANAIAFSQATTDVEMQIGVAVGTEAGETSPVALSPAFDTIKPGNPLLETYTMSGSSTLNVKWRPPTRTDTTPNDPLDVADSQLYTPQYIKDGRTVLLSAPIPGTTFTFTGPRPPFEFQVFAQNEWGTEIGAQVFGSSIKPTATMPAWVLADTSQNRISGTAAYGVRVILQARNSASSPWYTVGWETFLHDWYAFDLRAAGSRQYRVQVPNTKAGIWAYFGGYSPVVSTTVQIRASAHFWASEIRVGQTSRAALSMSPYLVGHARLERWNGKTWTLVGPVPIANGYGWGYIRGTTPGRVAYRYYVPSGYTSGTQSCN
ncbi:hypothetical protein [Kribbella caucasensis]|uniref:hypothetical protein n=1 Tax=Kribbella caucasensis TaxID=2512215 RepID=UPI00105F5CFE|nr:hypothetical protein [Kribbella sp. VKM Ac-2527]